MRLSAFYLLSATLCLLAATALPSQTAPLPQAPSAVIRNGRTYQAPTAKESAVQYLLDALGPRALVSATVRGGIEQARSRPEGWGSDAAGFGQRYASAFAEAGIVTSTRYGLAALFHEDVRYLVCRHCSARDKVSNALLSEFTARHGADGHRDFSLTPVAANFSGPLVAYAYWYPPSKPGDNTYSSVDAIKHSSLGFAIRIAARLLRESLDDKKIPFMKHPIGGEDDPAPAAAQPTKP